jgi:uncharacterized protein YjbJ (UPF0337 family)
MAMVNQQTLQGNWNELKGKIRSKWGQLTNDELQTFDGNIDRLVGLIQRKTGETRNSVEKYLEELTENGSSSFGQATEKAREYAHQAADTISQTSRQASQSLQKGYEQASQSMQRGYEQAENLVRERPGESLAVCFGAGVFVGVLVGLMLRSR